MAGRDRIVIVHVYLPAELKTIVQQYQDDRMLPTFSYAFRELIETHPSIVQLVEKVYATASQSERTRSP